MTHRSTGENSTDQMPLLCPLRTTEDTRFGSFHMHAVRSYRIMVMRSDSPIRRVKSSRKTSILNLTSEPLQTRPSSGETDRELISLSCAATPAFALRGTSPLASISASSQVQTLMVRSLTTREAYFRGLLDA
jgi:hypothetical protein